MAKGCPNFDETFWGGFVYMEKLRSSPSEHFSHESDSTIANVCPSVCLSEIKTPLISDIWLIIYLISQISDFSELWSLRSLISQVSDLSYLCYFKSLILMITDIYELWSIWSLINLFFGVSDLCSLRYLISQIFGHESDSIIANVRLSDVSPLPKPISLSESCLSAKSHH